MSLKGIDTSKWQAGLNDKTINADFIIFKATEGVGYTDPECDPSYQEAISVGKLVGVYHFARPDLNPNGAIEEANYFVDNILGYIGAAVLALDYETNTNVAWAKQWLDQVALRTGVNPMIYLSESAVNSADWQPICNTYGLWVAKYRDNEPDYNYDMSNAGTPPNISDWQFYAMWQWTSTGRLDGYSGNLDCNEFYGDANTWKLYAGAKPVVIPSTPPPVIIPPVVTPPVITPEPPAIIVPEPVTLSTVDPVIPTPVVTTPLPQLGFWSKVWAWIVNYINKKFGGKTV